MTVRMTRHVSDPSVGDVRASGAASAAAVGPGKAQPKKRAAPADSKSTKPRRVVLTEEVTYTVCEEDYPLVLKAHDSIIDDATTTGKPAKSAAVSLQGVAATVTLPRPVLSYGRHVVLVEPTAPGKRVRKMIVTDSA